MPRLQLSGLDIVHDIIPKGIPSLHISQHVAASFALVRTDTGIFRNLKKAILDGFIPKKAAVKEGDAPASDIGESSRGIAAAAGGTLCRSDSFIGLRVAQRGN